MIDELSVVLALRFLVVILPADISINSRTKIVFLSPSYDQEYMRQESRLCGSGGDFFESEVVLYLISLHCT